MTEVTNGPVQSEVRHCPEGSLCIPMRGSWEEWMDKDSGKVTTPSPRKDLKGAQKSVGRGGSSVSWKDMWPAPMGSFLSGFEQQGTLTNGERGDIARLPASDYFVPSDLPKERQLPTVINSLELSLHPAYAFANIGNSHYSLLLSSIKLPK